MSGALPGQMKRGALWGGASSFILRLGTFLVGVITARLIAPEEFGVFAIAWTTYAIVVHLSELGVGAVLMRQESNIDDTAPTVTAIAWVSSVATTLVLWVLAPHIASLLGSPDATAPIRVISLSVLVSGLAAVPNALLVRSFRQDRLAICHVTTFVASTTSVILLALAGGGALALSAAQVIGLFAGTVMMVVLAPKWYWPGFNRAEARELLRFGIPLSAANIANFTVYNVDYLVIGYLLGPTRLGYYLLAFNMSGWPSTVLNAMFTSVAMPAFARVRNDRARLSTFLTSTMSAVASLTIPMSILLGVLAAPVIAAVYGERWLPAAPALAAIAVFGGLRVFSELFSNILVALGNTRSILVVQLGWLLLLIPAMFLGVEWRGIVGAGLAHVVVISLWVIPTYLWLFHRIVGARPAELGRAVLPPLLAAGAAGLVAWGVSRSVSGAWIRLLLGGVAGLGVYGALLGRWLMTTQRTARALWGSVEDTFEEPVARRTPEDA